LSSIKKLVSQSATYGLSAIIGRFLNYLLVPLYTNIFSPDEYGVVTELYSYAAFLGVLFTYGMETAFFRFASQKKNEFNGFYATAFFSLLFSSIAFGLLLYLFIGPLSLAMGYENHQDYLWLFFGMLFFDTMVAIPFARLRLENKPLKFAAIKLANIFINISLNLFLLFPFAKTSGLSIHEYGIFWVFLANFFGSMATFLFLFKLVPQWKDFDVKRFQLLFKYGWPLLLAGLAGMVNETIDRILLKNLLPPETAMHDVGIYGACYKVSIIMTIFIQTYRMAAEPFFFSQATNKDLQLLNAKATFYFVVFCGFTFCSTMLFMDQVQYFIGKDFRSGLHIVPILLMANLFLGLYYSSSVWYKLAEKTMAGAWLSGLGAIITLTANFLLIPILGFEGSAWATFLCYASMTVVSFLWGHKVFPIPYFWMKMLFFLALALVLFIVSNFYAHWSSFNKIFMNVVLLSLYLGAFLWFEKAYFRSIFNRK